jgi:Lsr2
VAVVPRKMSWLSFAGRHGIVVNTASGPGQARIIPGETAESGSAPSLSARPDWAVAGMAKNVSVVVTDDLDGSPGAETASFSFGGQGYEIDLSPANLARLQETLRPYLDAARRAARPGPGPARTTRAVAAAPGIDRAAVRAWAAAQGLQVSGRGRISSEVLNKYQAAH